MTLDELFTYSTLAYRYKIAEWAQDFKIPTGEVQEMIEGAGRSLSRLGNYIQIISETEEGAPFYEEIIEREFGYSPDMEISLGTWWPDGLNHEVKKIRAKHEARRKAARLAAKRAGWK